jgi:tetratricopeptide (TPR) repeat protein
MYKFTKILFLLILLNAGGGVLYSQCQLGDEDKGVYKQMKFGMENHLYNDAKIRAKILLTKYGGTCPDLYFDAGWLSFYTQSWWDAVEFLKTSLRIMAYSSSRFEFAYSSVGISYYELGYYKESIAYLNEAIYIKGEAEYYKYRALSYYQLEDYITAMNDFQTAKKYGSDFTDEETDFFWDTDAKLKPEKKEPEKKEPEKKEPEKKEPEK